MTIQYLTDESLESVVGGQGDNVLNKSNGASGADAFFDATGLVADTRFTNAQGAPVIGKTTPIPQGLLDAVTNYPL